MTCSNVVIKQKATLNFTEFFQNLHYEMPIYTKSKNKSNLL